MLADRMRCFMPQRTTLQRPDVRPNGLVFSSRERATTSVSKAMILAREAVGWNSLFGAGDTSALGATS
jgi:hypothetical protein